MTVKTNTCWGNNVTLTWANFSGTNPTTYNVDSIKYGGEKQDLVELNDVCALSMYKDYVLGMKDTGELEMTLSGPCMLTVGSRGLVTLKLGGANSLGNIPTTGSETTIINALPAIVLESGALDVSSGSLVKSTVKVKILSNMSRLVSGMTGVTGG